MHKAKRRLERIRKINLLLLCLPPTRIEKSLADLYNHVRLKRKVRVRGETTARKTDEVLNASQDKLCISSYLAKALRELDKRKPNDEQHRKKCFVVCEYLAIAETLLPEATANQKRCFKYVKAFINAVIANQIIPGDY